MRDDYLPNFMDSMECCRARRSASSHQDALCSGTSITSCPGNVFLELSPFKLVEFPACPAEVKAVSYTQPDQQKGSCDLIWMTCHWTRHLPGPLQPEGFSGSRLACAGAWLMVQLVSVQKDDLRSLQRYRRDDPGKLTEWRGVKLFCITEAF